jgi:hypothetical protein
LRNYSDQSSEMSSNSNPIQLVARTAKAIDFRQDSKSEVAFRGTDLMPEVKGAAEVETKSGTTQIKTNAEHLAPANSFGLEYLTYL